MSTSSKIPEPSFNIMLTRVLQRKHPDWPRQLVAENIRVLSSGKGKKPGYRPEHTQRRSRHRRDQIHAGTDR